MKPFSYFKGSWYFNCRRIILPWNDVSCAVKLSARDIADDFTKQSIMFFFDPYGWLVHQLRALRQDHVEELWLVWPG